MKRWLILPGTALLLSALLAGSFLLWWWGGGASASVLTLQVEQGSTLASVARQLHARGLLRQPTLWRWSAAVLGADAQIKHGEYALSASMSPATLLAVLVAGEVVQYSVTLPEGINLRQALLLLQRQSALLTTLSGPQDPALLALTAPRQPEGLFFPDTYYFNRGDTDLDVLRKARQRMALLLRQSWAARAPDLPWRNAYEALIMASVVEKETGLASERATIAGVFVRRQQQHMKLQTDPTVIYGLGTGFDGNLRRHHLRDRSNPYNSYQHRGLPPTPIALPGRAAIEATVHPASGTALYFVARGDGSHHFSTTLAQHRAAVRRYQLPARADYRARPHADSDD